MLPNFSVYHTTTLAARFYVAPANAATLQPQYSFTAVNVSMMTDISKMSTNIEEKAGIEYPQLNYWMICQVDRNYFVAFTELDITSSRGRNRGFQWRTGF